VNLFTEPAEATTTVVAFRTSPERSFLIRAAAARHGVTASEWLRRRLEAGLKEEGLLPEDAREAA
jgi:hypothetical protein